MNLMRTEIKTSCLKRLKRIEGQIRGLAGMVEADRYCIDVVTQIAAARTSLPCSRRIRHANVKSKSPNRILNLLVVL
jgi:DNA-binding FrmR family transcriptional regulator